ncbi:hypothetical protein G5V57_28775 [Nordella sp. HKS 07]|uniref:hypothetical protein n=1 Tax=Nordella sp. HKS 07 TaxID=2712222 RepID=UPI0013E2006F|nr:hypothetical protein [Nordella sp. HKS 07]QIG51357.1 hypothetical protein G5V57_28775 [Nordella sp. HKS 07]
MQKFDLPIDDVARIELRYSTQPVLGNESAKIDKLDRTYRQLRRDTDVAEGIFAHCRY